MAAHTVDASGNFLVPNATFIAEFIAFLLILGILGRYVYAVIR
jgi:F0F1-type ATP synthase membrane subunit b/b'